MESFAHYCDKTDIFIYCAQYLKDPKKILHE